MLILNKCLLNEWMNEWMNSCVKAMAIKKGPEVRVKRLGNGWVLWERSGREEERRIHSESSGRNSRSQKRQLVENNMRTILPRHFFSSLPKKGPGGCLYYGDTWNRITSLAQQKVGNILHKQVVYFRLTSTHIYLKTHNKHHTKGKPHSFFFWPLQNHLSCPCLCQKDP